MVTQPVHQGVTMSDPKPSRHHTLWVVIATAVVTSLLTGATTAYAGHEFNDVSDSNPFHEEISWLSDTGISQGFADGGFHPKAAVTRQAMAAFLLRLFDHQALGGWVAGGDLASTTSTAWVDIPGATTEVFVPPASGASLVATFSADANCSAPTSGVFCSVRILVNGAEMSPAVGNDNSFASTNSGWNGHSLSRGGILLTGLFTVKVQYRVGSGTATFSVDNWLLSADADLLPAGP
jgi:hypothetical protein